MVKFNLTLVIFNVSWSLFITLNIIDKYVIFCWLWLAAVHRQLSYFIRRVVTFYFQAAVATAAPSKTSENNEEYLQLGNYSYASFPQYAISNSYLKFISLYEVKHVALNPTTC